MCQSRTKSHAFLQPRPVFGQVLQHMPWLRDSPGASFVAAPAMFLLAAVLNWCARRVRERAAW